MPYRCKLVSLPNEPYAISSSTVNSTQNGEMSIVKIPQTTLFHKLLSVTGCALGSFDKVPQFRNVVYDLLQVGVADLVREAGDQILRLLGRLAAQTTCWLYDH